jgi:hypothetical protein
MAAIESSMSTKFAMITQIVASITQDDLVARTYLRKRPSEYGEPVERRAFLFL